MQILAACPELPTPLPELFHLKILQAMAVGSSVLLKSVHPLMFFGHGAVSNPVPPLRDSQGQGKQGVVRPAHVREQGTPPFDAEIAEKSHLWMETSWESR